MDRIQFQIGDLEITAEKKKDGATKVTIFKSSLMPGEGIIPPGAILFWGDFDQLEDFLTRARKKFGHLYKRTW